jgi:hypothetical protein
MQRLSTRTLILMLELLVAVVSLQYIVAIRSARAGAVWLADDCHTTLPTPAEVNDCTVAS